MFIEVKELLFPSFSIWALCQVYNNSPFSGNSELALAHSSLNSCTQPPPAIVHWPGSNTCPLLAQFSSWGFGFDTPRDWGSVAVAKPRAYKHGVCPRVVLRTESWRKLNLQTQGLKPLYKEEQTEYGEKFWMDAAASESWLHFPFDALRYRCVCSSL